MERVGIVNLLASITEDCRYLLPSLGLLFWVDVLGFEPNQLVFHLFEIWRHCLEYVAL
jgi:hypothetical protein